ncbi:hypothetical protein M406DRAFT_322673 [Cryphonectria parasitica EP155]|uniref:Uncharacterized protein n=1 Tax=Cryphonectria parasitica (strain ATCC 38755 / EP155) TaxID=660469 RepID=A0A9P5CMZ9_CRYP1|nr:uncharacterized protein M406DRAFT_322673 [Cryphonectria parasitica EP155]KAF3764643.1 hypothetical protein M406DRAFT_322673 [Cryphonectria parasitica EP155]
MYFARVLVTLGLLTASTMACTAGTWSCGNQNGAPGPDGAVYECDSTGNWVETALCGGTTCCFSTGSNAGCSC